MNIREIDNQITIHQQKLSELSEKINSAQERMNKCDKFIEELTVMYTGKAYNANGEYGEENETGEKGKRVRSN
ncbi:hypothetical protein QTN25_001649 [Entamoeba marina]